MIETLYIRLGSQAQDTIHWLVLGQANTSDSEIIASGELKGAQQLSELTSKAEQRDVRVFVPGCDVLLKRLNVPAKSNRAMRLAVPYMLEDSFAEEVEQLFFAYADLSSDSEGHNCFTAIVAHNQIQQWQNWLAEADISIKSMVPDVLAMPINDNGWSAIGLGENAERQVIVRQDLWQGFTVDESAWQFQCAKLTQQQSEDENSEADVELDSENNEQEVDNIQVYSPVSGSEELNVEAMPEDLPLALMAKTDMTNINRFNLLQGDYKVTESRSHAGQQWLWVAGIAVFALLLSLGHKSIKLWQLNSAQEVVQQQITETYKKAFPKTKKVRVSTIKSQLNRELALLGGGSDSGAFLTMLSKVQPGFLKVSALKPESLKYDSKRNELRIQAKAKDYQAFEKFTQVVSSSGLVVKLGSQSNQGDAVTGSLIITDKAKSSGKSRNKKKTRGAS